MSSVRTVILVCDYCGKEGDLVETHTVAMDGHAVEFEACEKDYGKLVEVFAAAAKAGRRVVQKRAPRKTSPAIPAPQPRIPDAVEFPGHSWRFTFHALERMGQRKMPPMRVVHVIENPEVEFTDATKDNLVVRMAGNYRIAVDPVEHIVVTAALRDEELQTAV